MNNRYYNPEWGRFINADGIICADKDLLSHNLYIYAGNNPIINVDPTGNGFFTVLFVALVAVVTVKATISSTSKAYLTATKNDLSNDMFQKAMHGPTGNVSKKIKKKIENKTKNTKQIKDTIQSCINQSNGKSFTSSDCSGSVEFTEGDLYYSIQKTNYKISGEKNSDSTWNISVNLYDTYDFTELRKGFTKGDLANNLGFTMQHTGLLIPYDWDVKYSMTYTEE